MGYNKSMGAFNRVRTFLDAMLQSNENLVWEIKHPNTPDSIAIKIREGISAALRHNQPHKSLLNKFVIKVKGTYVIAQLRSYQEIPLPNNSQDIFHRTVSTLVIGEPANLESVMTVLIKNNIPDSVRFTAFVYPTDDEDDWWNFLEWCKTQDYEATLASDKRILSLTKRQSVIWQGLKKDTSEKE